MDGDVSTLKVSLSPALAVDPALLVESSHSYENGDNLVLEGDPLTRPFSGKVRMQISTVDLRRNSSLWRLIRQSSWKALHILELWNSLTTLCLPLWWRASLMVWIKHIQCCQAGEAFFTEV